MRAPRSFVSAPISDIVASACSVPALRTLPIDDSVPPLSIRPPARLCNVPMALSARPARTLPALSRLPLIDRRSAVRLPPSCT
ncbi:conserved hypothetical protein, partial [Burkholderia multivorans CGD2M]